MKALLGIFVVLLYVQLVVSQWPIPTDVKNINKNRQEVAKMLKITNMNNLVWDDDLATAANRFSSACREWTHRPEYRVSPIGNGYDYVAELPRGIDTFTAEFRKDSINDTYNGDLRALLNNHRELLNRIGQDPTINLHHFEDFHPLQTKIGCAKKHCDGKKNGKSYSFEGLCLLGPKGTVQVSDIGFPGFPALSMGADPERSLGTDTTKSIAPTTARSVVTDSTTESKTDSATGNLALGLIGAFVAWFLF